MKESSSKSSYRMKKSSYRMKKHSCKEELQREELQKEDELL